MSGQRQPPRGGRGAGRPSGGGRDERGQRGPGGGAGQRGGGAGGGPPRGGRGGSRPFDGRRGPGDGNDPPPDRLVYGRNAVCELLRAERREVFAVHATHQVASADWLEGVRVRETDPHDLADLAGSGDHQGIVAECGPYPYAPLERLIGRDGVVVVLDEITDPRNVGAIARTAEATGAIGLILPERRSAQVTATVCKTSAGAVEHLQIARVRNVTDALAQLKEGGAWSYGAAMDGTPVADVDLGGRVALVMGGEGKGLRPRVASACDVLVSLPMAGHVDSLNVSAAAAVLLYAAMGAQPPR